MNQSNNTQNVRQKKEGLINIIGNAMYTLYSAYATINAQRKLEKL